MRFLPLALLCSAVVACQSDTVAQPSHMQARIRDDVRPNFLVIVTDDQTVASASASAMPRLNALIGDRGAVFANSFVPTSHCCPSRASFLRGQYAHNTGVLSNDGEFGGFQRAVQMGIEESTIATWLDARGYRTSMIGKYLNGYHVIANAAHVAPGWDAWFAIVGYNPVRAAENGQSVVVSGYATDLLRDRAADAIRAAAGEPFFVLLNLTAPHAPADPAPRHAGLEASTLLPESASFGEPDLSDKPAFLRRGAFRAGELNHMSNLHRRVLESLRAVDEAVEHLMAVLEAEGLLGNTYVVYTSDNGYQMGEHAVVARKNLPYDESIRVPLMIAGPGVASGTRSELVLNIDLAPTLAALAGADVPDFVDGRSLVPLLRGQGDGSGWRQRFLIEHWPSAGQLTQPPMAGFRDDRMAYHRWQTGEVELYNLVADPHQLAADTSSGALPALDAVLDRLTACAGVTCRAAEE